MKIGIGTETTHWHPVCQSADLGEGGYARPLAVQLLGQAVVLWRDERGQAHAWADRCPHRGAKLSLGRVQVGASGQALLQCAYHGWAFEGSGHCVQVPAQPQWQPPSGHCARVFECHEALGLLWVQLEQPQNAPPEPWKVPEVDSDWVSAVSGPHNVATSAPRLVENFLDMTHFGFVHAGSLGDPAHTELPGYEVCEHGPEDAHGGARGISVPNCKVWQPNPFDSGQPGSGQWVHYRYQTLGPYSVMLDKLGGADSRQRLVIAMLNCPVLPEQTRTWFWIAAQGLGQTPEQMAAFQDAIFAEDRRVVESQTPKALPLTSGEVHGPLDRVSAAYRRYLAKSGVMCGVVP